MATTFDDDASGEGGAWKPVNLADSTAIATERALGQIMTGGVVAALWGLIMVGCVALRFYGIHAVTSVYWDIAGGVAMLVIALGAAARSRASMAILSLLVAADVPVQMFGIHDAVGRSAEAGRMLAIGRLCILPIVLYIVTRGYRGAVDYHLIRRKSLPKNWRFWAPLQFVGGVVAYAGFVLIVVLFWKGPFRHGLEQAGARIRTDRAVTPLMQALYADLRAIDIKPFENVSGDRQGKPRPSDGKDKASPAGGVLTGGPAAPAAGSPAAPVYLDIASLPKPVRDAVEEATNYATRVDEVGCLTEALRRHDSCNEDACRLLAKVFMTACLPASRPTDDFCNGVPSPLAVVETAAWNARVCDQTGRPAEPCHVFFRSLQNFCHPEAIAESQ